MTDIQATKAVQRLKDNRRELIMAIMHGSCDDAHKARMFGEVRRITKVLKG